MAETTPMPDGELVAVLRRVLDLSDPTRRIESPRLNLDECNMLVRSVSEALATRARPEPQPVGSTPGRREEIARIVERACSFGTIAEDDQPRNAAWKAADQIMALPSEQGDDPDEHALLQQAWGALNFILAFYEPGQRYLDTEAWKQAEATGRRAWEALNAHLRATTLPPYWKPEALARADQLGREVG